MIFFVVWPVGNLAWLAAVVPENQCYGQTDKKNSYMHTYRVDQNRFEIPLQIYTKLDEISRVGTQHVMKSQKKHKSKVIG